MNIIFKRLLKTLLTCGLNWLVGYLLKSQWLHFKILGYVEKKAKSSDNKIDDWGVTLVRYMLEKWHGLRPMNSTDKLIATTVLTAIADNGAIDGFTFNDLSETKRKLGLDS